MRLSTHFDEPCSVDCAGTVLFSRDVCKAVQSFPPRSALTDNFIEAVLNMKVQLASRVVSLLTGRPYATSQLVGVRDFVTITMKSQKV